MISAMMQRIRELLVLLFLAVSAKAVSCSPKQAPPEGVGYCLSWRLGVEANNIRAWRTVPTQCLRQIESYMIGGQYDRDLNMVIENIVSYINDIVLSDDGLDAWILDVDDTCISNILFYKGKRFGCDPYDPQGFKAWASKGGCPAIPAVLRLFNKLVESGFKVFLVTGRDTETLFQPTLDNLHNQGFTGYERLILRTLEYKGQSAVMFKSGIRKQLEEEGYRIWGNVGDQWSDLQGECIGNRTFKLPNPMTLEYKGQSAVMFKSGIRKQLEGEGYRIWGNVGDQWSDLQGECIGNRTFKLPNPMYFVP